MTNRKIICLAAGLGLAVAAFTWSASVVLTQPAQQVARHLTPRLNQTAEVGR